MGFEPLPRVTLREGQALPYDRHWAVAHERAKFEGTPETWQHKANFLRGVTAPGLMAIRAAYDEDAGVLRLSHPEAGEIAVNPDREGDELVDWLRPIWGDDLPAPRNVISIPGQAMTDWPDPFISVLGTASLKALGQRAGVELSPHRFRGNLWVDGWAPFEEFDLIGRKLKVGEAELEIRERITRCKATCANPETGRRDVDVPALLRDAYGHEDFGIYAVVTRGGEIAEGDDVTVL